MLDAVNWDDIFLCNVADDKMSSKVYLSFCICVFAQSVFAIKYSLQNQFQSTISTRYCVDDDDDDSGGRTQRDC